MRRAYAVGGFVIGIKSSSFGGPGTAAGAFGEGLGRHPQGFSSQEQGLL